MYYVSDLTTIRQMLKCLTDTSTWVYGTRLVRKTMIESVHCHIH